MRPQRWQIEKAGTSLLLNKWQTLWKAEVLKVCDWPEIQIAGNGALFRKDV